MINILVTGGNGQLANCLRDLTENFSNLNFVFKDSKTLNITKLEDIEDTFNKTNYNYCLNCAAYTAVDKAESNIEKAIKINELGTRNIAEVCSKNNTVLIHISTDFVFSGNKSYAYVETDNTEPINIYGLTKLNGEKAIQCISKRYYIVRTSWLYSEHNSNFLKTMLNLSKSRSKLNVVDDQIGTPTYAKDLAEVIISIINSKSDSFGIYHYSNEGVASWYDFAQEIFDNIKSEIKLFPIRTKDYKVPAKRPYFSVLDKTKIKENFNIDIPYWKVSLKKALLNLKSR